MRKPYPIFGWCSLRVDLARPEVFATIADAGINIFMTTTQPEAIAGQLDLAAEHGLKAMVCDPRFRPSLDPADLDAARRAADEYAGHAGVAGYYVWDEPTADRFEAVGAMVAALRTHDPDRIAYVNAFGFGGRGCDSFDAYVEQYAAIIKPAFLSFDHYPITRRLPPGRQGALLQADIGIEVPELDAFYRDQYWEVWETFHHAGRRHGLPLWGFVLATPHQHSVWFYGPVTEGTLRLELFTGLAYGAQAIQYFTLPTESMPGWEHGILDPEGRPSIRHALFKRVNRDLSVLGPVVAELRDAQVYYTGPLTSGMRRFAALRGEADTSHHPVAGIQGDPVVLSFQRGPNGEQYLLVVNRHPARSARVFVELEAGFHAAEILKDTGAVHRLPDRHFWCGLEPGDGRLFVLAGNQ